MAAGRGGRDLAAQGGSGSRTPKARRAMDGPARLVAQDVGQHARNQTGGQIFGQQPDQVAPVVERFQHAPSGSAAAVIHARQRLVLALPAEQLGAKGEVDVFQVHEERLVE